MKNIQSWIIKIFLTISGISIVAVTWFEFNLNMDMSKTQNNNKTETNIEKVIIVAGKNVSLDSVLGKILSVSADNTNIKRPPVNIVHERRKENKPARVEKPETIRQYKEATSSKSDNVLQNNIAVNDFLAARHDKNLYTFTLNSLSEVSITFRPSSSHSESYKLTVFDSFSNILAQKYIDSETSSLNTGNLYLGNGTYTAEIVSGNLWYKNSDASGKIYTITLSAYPAVNSESENNDSFQRANYIPLNKDIRASTGSSSDIDYFTFTLDEAFSVCPSLKFDSVEGYSLKLYNMVIEDSKGKTVRSFIFRGDGKPSKTVRPFSLKAGTYIIAISRTEDTQK